MIEEEITGKKSRTAAYRGYELMISNLPWGKEGSFTVKRYRLAEGQDFGAVDETPASGDRIKIRNLLAPPALELIVLQRR